MHARHCHDHYTGHWPMGSHGGPDCCPPPDPCGCRRECRKEAKSLLASSSDKTARGDQPVEGLSGRLSALVEGAAAAAATTFIGGGCCVTLSVEYAPISPTVEARVLVAVEDSEGTALVWSRTEKAGTGYRIHERIITTNPGARLSIRVTNATARVRWCEVFSC